MSESIRADQVLIVNEDWMLPLPFSAAARFLRGESIEALADACGYSRDDMETLIRAQIKESRLRR